MKKYNSNKNPIRSTRPTQQDPTSSSWEGVSHWYDQTVGSKGSYYHQHIVIPNILKLLRFPESPKEISLLDLACGQGILSRSIPSEIEYQGIDLSKSLIKSAKSYTKNPQHHFSEGDITKPLPIKKKNFDYATVILALQNIENPLAVFKNCASHLKDKGQLLLVLNHPCFRIPRQSSWGEDANNKIRYRRVDRYMSQMKIPIQAHPSQGEKSSTSWSFHYSLSDLSRWLYEAGFMVTLIEEWCSDKESEGKKAKSENRSREEIPLFMAVLAAKIN